MDALRAFHPGLRMVYFVGALVVTLLSPVPYVVVPSFIAALLYASVGRRDATLRAVKRMLWLIPAIAIFNAFINRHGFTILFYAFGLPISLEALLYGVHGALMLTAVMLWFARFQSVISNGDIVRLVGRGFRTFGMMTAMVFRYVPDSVELAEDMERCRHGLIGGQAPREGRLAMAVRRMNHLFLLSLERSVVTVAAMRAKGYGERRRPARLARLLRRDVVFGLVLVAMIVAAASLAASGGASFLFYPFLFLPPRGRHGFVAGWLSIVSIAYFVLPACLGVWQRWRASRVADADVKSGLIVRDVSRGRIGYES